MEEGHELLDRLNNGGVLPMITSCSPGWIRFCEFNYPEFIPNLSSCKSPAQMLGAIIKSYYAEKNNLDAKKIFNVSVMPCISKKSEAERPEMQVNGNRDIDAVLSTRELAKMIKEARINFVSLEEDAFDQDLLGEYTGAGAIFGATGGVMTAALRTVANVSLDFNAVSGLEGIKEAEVAVGDKKVKVAVVHGTGNAAKLLDKIKSGEAKYDFIEIMACGGGCVTGGGQPKIDASTRATTDIRKERAKILAEEDNAMPLKRSHENSQIKKLYDEYLEKPNSHRAHELLHTKYAAKETYPV
jgi:NADH-quinone oxidoreductase subunit G/NADP-reducing hydrogenase subunit HndD